MYLSGALVREARPHLDAGQIGLLNTPKNKYAVQQGWTWAADSGLFNAATYVGDDAYMEWLGRQPHRESCLFATAPDVLGDAAATLARSAPYLPRIRAMGYPVALVTQDGLTPNMVPWADIDWLFLGGTDRHKLGQEALALIRAARDRGVPVHVGRVNSGRRYARFAALGCASADGTCLAFGPQANLPKVLAWAHRHRTELPLFDAYYAKLPPTV